MYKVCIYDGHFISCSTPMSVVGWTESIGGHYICVHMHVHVCLFTGM